MKVSSTITQQPVSAIILAQNESALISRCISSLQWADEIIVLDSGSSDDTASIARVLGARVIEQPWLGWSRQRNMGAKLASNDWILVIEADEFVSQELQSSLLRVLGSNPHTADGWAVDRRDEFLGREMTQAQRRSKVRSRVRLYNRSLSSWDEAQEVHETVIVTGRVHLLTGRLIHWRREDLPERFARLARYARIEAGVIHRTGRRPTILAVVFRPLLRFAWLYFARRGIARGEAGFYYAVTTAIADFLRFAHVRSLQRHPTELHPDEYSTRTR